MADFPDGFLVGSLISDIFTIDNQLTATRTADLFKAFDHDRGRSIGVWIYRTPLNPSDPAVANFVKRMGKISQVAVRAPKLFSIGLDPSGYLFSVIENVEGFSILKGNIDMREAERRWVAIVQMVEALHAYGLPVGDVGPNSFWVSRSGDISFVGVMGDPGNKSSQPMLEDLQRLCELGVLLFAKANRMTIDDEGKTMPALEAALKGAPGVPARMIQLVLENTADAASVVDGVSFAERFRSLKEQILEQESQLTERGDRRLQAKSPDNKVTVFRAAAGAKDANEEKTDPADPVPTPLSKRTKIILGSAFAALFAACLCGAFFILRSSSAPEAQTEINVTAALRSAADLRTSQVSEILQSTDLKVAEKRAKFEELSQSDDSVANSLLIETAMKTQDQTERVLAEKALLDRAKRLGHGVVAQLVSQWLKTVNLNEFPPEYGLVLQVIDGTIPSNARSELLERIFSLNPLLGGQLLAAFVLSEDPAPLQDTVRHLVTTANGAGIPEYISAPAALSAMPDWYQPVLELYKTGAQKFSDAEVSWAFLRPLAKNETPSTVLVTEVEKRKVFGPYTHTYLAPLELEEKLPEGTLSLLGRLLNKTVTRGDVEQLGVWLHPASLAILQILLLEPYSNEVLQEAAEYVAGRAGGNVYAGALFSSIKKLPGDVQGKIIPLIGVTTTDRPHEDAVIDKALEPLVGLDDYSIFSVLLRSSNQSFLRRYLTTFHEHIPGASMVSLLSNPDPSVRIAAVRALKTVNQTAVLQVAIQAYESEKDPAVRKIYEEELWVIKERIKK